MNFLRFFRRHSTEENDLQSYPSVLRTRFRNMIRKWEYNLNWLRNSQTVYAVHANDLEALSSILETDVDSKIRCFYCGKSLDKNNLGGWIKMKEGFSPFCDDLKCLPAVRQEEGTK